ncbi:hypothetical protein X801_02598, partial [Opisthorchis viverrini]
MCAEAPKFSFTFSKQKKPLLQTPATAVQKREAQINKKEIREYITAIEDNVIHSTNPAPTQLVIPLIQSKNGIRRRMQAATRSATSTTDALTQQALEELAADSDASGEVNYEAIPVESFGLAALAGMGFNPEDLKSATGQPIGPIRPKGLGLGADPRVLQTPKPEENDESKKKLEWTTGAHCQAVLGKYKGKYGTLVIPLIHSKHGIRRRMQAATRSATSTTDALTQQALEELAAANLHIQLPSALVDSDASGEVNYEAIPVESFGLAALAGMGFNPEDLKSATGQPIGSIRPKGLGLGADPRVLQTPKPEENDESKKKLEWTTGAHCQAVLGKYKGKYGTINGMDGDTGRVIVKFTISKEIASVLQPMLRLVPEKEYSKYANCLNQSEVDLYKAEEEQLQQQGAADPYKSFSSYNDRFPYSKIERDSYVPPHKPSHQPKPHDPYSWVRPKLLVRLLDRHYLNGKYYRQKVTITKVDSGLCTCVTRSGEVLEGEFTAFHLTTAIGIHPKYLKTVIPECNNTMVMILHGPRNGEMAKLMERHLETNEVDLRTRAGTMISLRYDQICM